MKRISVKTMFLLVEAGAAVSMLALSLLLSAMTGEGRVLLAGVLLTACALAWLFLLTLFFAKRHVPHPGIGGIVHTHSPHAVACARPWTA